MLILKLKYSVETHEYKQQCDCCSFKPADNTSEIVESNLFVLFQSIEWTSIMRESKHSRHKASTALL